MFFVFYFIKTSKFALPGVMLIYERTSKDRKKERNKASLSDWLLVVPNLMYMRKGVNGRIMAIEFSD